MALCVRKRFISATVVIVYYVEYYMRAIIYHCTIAIINGLIPVIKARSKVYKLLIVFFVLPSFWFSQVFFLWNTENTLNFKLGIFRLYFTNYFVTHKIKIAKATKIEISIAFRNFLHNYIGCYSVNFIIIFNFAVTEKRTYCVFHNKNKVSARADTTKHAPHLSHHNQFTQYQYYYQQAGKKANPVKIKIC